MGGKSAWALHTLTRSALPGQLALSHVVQLTGFKLPVKITMRQ